MSVEQTTTGKSGITQLYRWWDKGDNLLYVGISFSAMARASQHKSDSGWYWDAVKVTIENYNSREEALYAEYISIQLEKPKFNSTHNSNYTLKAFKIAKTGKSRNIKCIDIVVKGVHISSSHYDYFNKEPDEITFQDLKAKVLNFKGSHYVVIDTKDSYEYVIKHNKMERETSRKVFVAEGSVAKMKIELVRQRMMSTLSIYIDSICKTLKDADISIDKMEEVRGTKYLLDLLNREVVDLWKYAADSEYDGRKLSGMSFDIVNTLFCGYYGSKISGKTKDILLELYGEVGIDYKSFMNRFNNKGTVSVFEYGSCPKI